MGRSSTAKKPASRDAACEVAQQRLSVLEPATSSGTGRRLAGSGGWTVSQII